MKRRILIVEDDLKSRYALHAVLQDLGHAVVACDSAEEAATYYGQPFDTAIIDVRLPQKQGPQFALNFKETHPDSRIIFVTAYNDIADVRKVVPGSIVMVKPLDMEVLIKLL